MANDDFAGGCIGRKDSGGSDVFGRFSDMATDEFRRIFPIPEDVILVNPNIKQNPNY